jgi:hypothetical protein
MPSAESIFPVMVFAVVALSSLVGVWSAVGMGTLYHRIGAGGLDIPFTAESAPPGSPQAAAERTDEIRQLLDAKSRSLQLRGRPALDVDAELARLCAEDRRQ